MTEVWYAEEATFDGRWSPVLYHGDAPATDQASGVLRIRASNGAGPRLRSSPVRIEGYFHHLTLDQLFEIYSPDGRFRYHNN